MKELPYYLPQDDWTSDDYYALHRYMHRMIFYHDKRMNEIESLDLNRMSEKTRVILYCLIIYYRLSFLMELKNLEDLKSCKPLKTPLVIDGATSFEDDVYKEMNVIY